MTMAKINKNIHYFVLMTQLTPIPGIPGLGIKSSTDREYWVECKIDESRYKVSDGYKVTLKAIDERFGSEDLYQLDFESLIESGCILPKTKDDQHVEEIKWFEPLTSTVLIEHNGFVVV